MNLEVLSEDFTICKLKDVSGIDLNKDFFFIGKTDDEISLVCKTEDVPGSTTEREDGWKALRVCAVLDFSLVGILSEISGVLAANSIGLFAISTYNTDYILVKKENFENAQKALKEAGHAIF